MIPTCAARQSSCHLGIVVLRIVSALFDEHKSTIAGQECDVVGRLISEVKVALLWLSSKACRPGGISPESHWAAGANDVVGNWPNRELPGRFTINSSHLAKLSKTSQHLGFEDLWFGDFRW